MDSAVEASESTNKAGTGQILLGFALAILSAVMLYVMWAYTYNIWPFAFIAFVPMYIAAYRLLPRRLAPLAVGIAAFSYWYTLVLQGGGVLSTAEIVAGALAMGIIWTLISIPERKFTERTNYKWFLVQFPLLWVGIEYLLGGNLLMGSNFWLAYRAAPAPELIQPVSITSSPALSFLMLMVNAAIALLILKWMDGRWPNLAEVKIPSVTVKWTSITAFGLAIIWVATSIVIFNQVTNEMGPAVRVAAVQSGIQNTTSSGTLGGGGQQGTPADVERNKELQAQLTRMTTDAAKQGAQLVVWPEEELDYDVRINGQGDWVGDLAKATNTTIVSGFMPDSPNLTSPNLAAVWFPNGQRQAEVYAKQHPVIAEGEAFVPGTLNPVYQTNFGRLGVIICFDHDFPNGSPRTTVAAGANIMAVSAIDPYTITELR